MRIGAGDFGATPLIEVRLATGALVLLPFLWMGRAAFRAEQWPWIALVGLINSAIPFSLFAWAAQRAPADPIFSKPYEPSVSQVPSSTTVSPSSSRPKRPLAALLGGLPKSK